MARQLSRLDQAILLRHRTGIILSPEATCEDIRAAGLYDDDGRAAASAPQRREALVPATALEQAMQAALREPPTREELRAMGHATTAELRTAGLL
jgi:hypothetical protein